MRSLLRVCAVLGVATAVFMAVSAPAAATTLPTTGSASWTVRAAGAGATARMTWHKDASSADYLDFVVSVHGSDRKKTLWYSGIGPISVVRAASDVPGVQGKKGFPSLAALQSWFRGNLHFDKGLTPLLAMRETGGGNATCTGVDAGAGRPSSACSSIDLLGSQPIVPGRTPKATTVTIASTGALAATSFTLRAGSCTQRAAAGRAGTATDLCSRAVLTIGTGSSTLFRGSLSDLMRRGALSLGPIVPGGTRNYRFWLSLPATTGNTYQGLVVQMPITWTFNR